MCQLKIEALKKEKLEAERKAEEKRQEDMWHQLKELKKKKEVQEYQCLADLKAKDKQKTKEDEANELALLAAGALLVSDGDSKNGCNSWIEEEEEDYQEKEEGEDPRAPEAQILVSQCSGKQRRGKRCIGRAVNSQVFED